MDLATSLVKEINKPALLVKNGSMDLRSGEGAMRVIHGNNPNHKFQLKEELIPLRTVTQIFIHYNNVSLAS